MGGPPSTATRATWLLALALSALGCASSAAPPEVSAAGFDRGRLALARVAALELRSMLEAYYGGPEVLEQSFFLAADSPAARRGLRALADKMARAVVWRDGFTIATIGSSVTAGFANCRHDTYQEQLRRLMTPVWTAAGVDFEIRNAGHGGLCGDSYRNQVWCLESLVGTEVDITHYSWTYFEVGNDDAPLAHELFYRFSLALEGSPVPQLLYTDDCSIFTGREQDLELLARYAGFGADVLCMERGLRGAGYERPEPGTVGDGLHLTTREGEALAENDARRQSLGVVFRDWHPGPLLFQTTADALAYRYTAALLMALDLIEAEPRPSRRWPRQRSTRSPDEMPAPMLCPESECAAGRSPLCLNLEEPVIGRSAIERLAQEEPGASWRHWYGDPGMRFVPEPERHLPQCDHPARCAGLKAPAGTDAGWLRFRLPELQLGLVAICCSAKECGTQLLEAGARFTLDGKPPASPPRVRWRKCVEVQPAFSEAPADGGRTVVLGLRLPARQRPLPAITHVIGL